MKILITGASGFVGTALCAALKEKGHEVGVLSRNAERTRQNLPNMDSYTAWDPENEPASKEALEKHDAVIHLAGENVAGRWSKAKKAKIFASRDLGTQNLIKGLKQCGDNAPKTLISASAIGYYGERGDDELPEAEQSGDDFLAKVCTAWENAACAAEKLGVRTVRVRIGIVLDTGGGALDAMLLPFKLGAGGPLGSGKQWWSWIHRTDLVALLCHALENEHISGVLNGTAPHPVRQKDFAKVMGKVLRRPAFLPGPAFAIRLAVGEFSTELLSSKKVLPKTALSTGFEFAYPELQPALENILR
ncbi:MAG: TIGR01777 family oxidoreductase [Myxococcota bacterium]|jgi:hypothetical protein|nr:TIGR01777 family oxidoreductase [Myxococcota bacterium]